VTTTTTAISTTTTVPSTTSTTSKGSPPGPTLEAHVSVAPQSQTSVFSSPTFSTSHPGTFWLSCLLRASGLAVRP
jgi:hypothetical protein